MAYLSVALGGAVGAALRFAIAQWLTREQHWLPWGTLAANVLGCFLMGLLIHSAPLSNGQNLRLLIATGFCGGFTTMSAFVFELHTLRSLGQPMSAGLYLAVTIVAAVAAFMAGQLVFRLLGRIA